MSARLGYLGLAVVALSGAACHSQTKPATLERACVNAQTTIEKAQPIRSTDNAFRVITSCGSAGAASIARAIRSLRSLPDTTALNPYYYAANNWTDRSIAETALSIASDPSAAVPARVLAFNQIIVSLKPSRAFTYAELTRVPAPNSGPLCAGRHMSDPAAIPGAPLAADYKVRALAAASQVARSESASATVRTAARCASFVLAP